MMKKRYDIIKAAIDELGHHDHETVSPTRYFSGGYNWCAEFYCYVLKQAGYPLDKGSFSSRVPEIPGDDGSWMQRTTLRLIDWFKENSMYIERGTDDWYAYVPKPGDFAYIGRYGYGLPEDRLHAGMVEYVSNDGSLHTIEGNNAGRTVMRFEYPIYKINDSNNGVANGIVMGIGVLSV